MNPYKYQTFNTLTFAGRRKRALYFIQGIYEPYIVLAKPTIWNSDDIPPTDYPNDIEFISEPIIYKKVISIEILEGNACNIKNANKFSYINNGFIKTYQEDTVQVIITTRLNSLDIGSTSFRIIGLYSDLVLSNGISLDKEIYQPYEVKDPGILHWFSISTPLTFNYEDSREINIVLLF